MPEIHGRLENKNYMTPEQRIAYNREYKRMNRDRCLEVRKEWMKRNRDRWIVLCRGYNSRHKTQIQESHRKYQLERRHRDLQFRLAGNLRARIGESLKKNHKNGSSVKDLGCSIEKFKDYIEKQWSLGMSWENYGKNGWHMDHIIPLASVNLANRTQFLKVCHYTNYQPLWASENIKKSNKENL